MGNIQDEVMLLKLIFMGFSGGFSGEGKIIPGSNRTCPNDKLLFERNKLGQRHNPYTEVLLRKRR